MYPHVAAWFKDLLAEQFPRHKITTFNTSRNDLSKFLFEKRLHSHFPDYQTYEIRVDITGVIQGRKGTVLGFVECKLGKITLRDLSQLIGYSKVANPAVAFIVSPSGITSAINSLFNVRRRYDVLEYGKGHSITIARWNESTRDLDRQSLISV